MEFDNAANHTFVVFNNRQMIIERDAQQTCKSRGVEWEEMRTQSYVAPNNPVHVDDSTENRYVCKATVDDNELPGVVHVSQKNASLFFMGKLALLPSSVELFQ